jgi:chromosome segregation ATPase
LEDYKSQHEKIQTAMSDLNSQLTTMQDSLTSTQSQVVQLTADKNGLQQQVTEKADTITQLEASLKEMTMKITQLQKKIEDFRKTSAQDYETIDGLKDEQQTLEEELEGRTPREPVRATLQAHQDAYKKVLKEVTVLEEVEQQLRTTAETDKEAQLKKDDENAKTIEAMETEIAEKNATIEAKDGEIKSLETFKNKVGQLYQDTSKADRAMQQLPNGR